MQEAKKGDTSLGKFNIKQNRNLKKVLVLSLMIIICTMVLQPSMDAAAKKNGGGGGGGGKSGSNSSNNSHAGSNDKSNGVGSEHSNGKDKKNLDDTSTPPDMVLGMEVTEENLTSDQPDFEKPNDHVPSILLVKFKDKTGEKIKNAVINVLGAKVQDSINEIDLKIIKVPENAIDNIKSALEILPIVEYVETDSIIEPTIVPDDTEFPKQWHLTKIRASAAWDINEGIPNTVIAILDSGFDLDHVDLKNKLVAGYNVYSNNNDISPAPCEHGTKVAGVASSSTNNNIGVAGIGWNAMIMPIKITNDLCYTSSSSIAKGLVYAADHGARVANISFQIFAGDKTINQAARYFVNHDGIVVASAGNTGKLAGGKDNQYIISVGASNPLDRIAIFSTRGNFVDFVAPGVDVLTTCVCEKIVVVDGIASKVPTSYIEASGTSFSSPLVAGVISLILSENPNLSLNEVYDILIKSSVDLGDPGRDNTFGYGLIDAKKALELAASSKLM